MPGGVQGYDRYAYVNNNPIRYTDPTGHFTCQNNSTSFSWNCHEIIEAYLSILESKGGEEGKALVKAFRDADTVTHYNRGGGYEVEDQITITITEDGNGGGGYLGGLDFSLSDSVLINSNETDSLVHAGQLGHEIVHLTQDDAMDQLLGISSGSLRDEIDAYDTQSSIYNNMRLGGDDHGTVAYAAQVASYKGKSPEEILSASWATAKDQYNSFPLFDGGNRSLDNWLYLEKPSIRPLPLNLFHGN